MTLRALALAAAVCTTGAASAQDATMLVLDASGSMWGQIDGVNKIVIAQDVVRDTLGTVVGDAPVGLIAYGHNRKGDCSDIELLVPVAQGQAPAVATAVQAIRPRGKTPLTDAVRQATQAMRSTEAKATVVLVTDGLETCGADPCALARELEQTGLDFTAHVVGFGLSKADGAAVACLAEETGGRYVEADNASELAEALAQTVAQEAAPPETQEPPQVEPKHNLQINVQLSPDSPPLEVGQIDKLTLNLIRQPDGAVKNIGYDPVMAIKVEADDYILQAKYAGGLTEQPVTIDRFDVTHAQIALNAGVIDFRVVPQNPDLIDPATISWRITNVDTGARADRYEPALQSVFVAGTYDVSVILGRKDATSPPPVRIDVTAGDVSDGEIILPHGAVQLVILDEAGSPLPRGFTRFGLWSAKPDGTPDRLVVGLNDTKNALLALPGEYLLVAEDWGIAKGGKRKFVEPITIAPGTGVAQRIVMPSDPALPMRKEAP